MQSDWLGRWRLIVLLALAAFAFAHGKAAAQTPDDKTDLILKRLEQLEKQNQALRQELNDLRRQQSAVGASELGGQQDIQKIVTDILNQKAQQKKKTEAEAAKKKKAENEQEDAEKLYKSHLKKIEDDQKAEVEKEKKAWHTIDGSDLSAKVSWDSGRLTFESPGNDWYFAITGRLHADTGWYNQTAGMPNLEDATSIRRARIGLQGRIWENLYFRTAYDFANSTNGGPFTNFRDAYIRFENLPYLKRLQIGQMKEPMSLSWSTSSNALSFLERPLPVNAIIPDRNTGLLVARTFGDEERIWVGGGLYRNLGNVGAFSQGDGQYAATGRITGLPYWSGDGRCLVHVGGYGSVRSFAADQGPRFGDRSETRNGTPRILDTGQIVGATDNLIYGVEASAQYGPWQLTSEVLGTSFNLPTGEDVSYWGAYAFVSYFITGEHLRYKKSAGAYTTVVPFNNFYLAEGPSGLLHNWGAWQVGLRWSYTDLHDADFVVPTAANRTGGTGTVTDVTAALNWYLNPQTTIMFNYIHGWRVSDTPGRSGEDDTAAVRLRIWF